MKVFLVCVTGQGHNITSRKSRFVDPVEVLSSMKNQKAGQKKRTQPDSDLQGHWGNPIWASRFGRLPAPGQHTLQWPLILFLAFFSFLVTGFFFLKDNTLYWDTGQHFIQFRDNLHSINKFGEIAWWFPQCQLGWPNYYYSILGFPHGAAPQFALLGAICWLLGRLGILIEIYQPIYVFYFSFLNPLVFLISVSLFARHFLKTRLALNFALIAAAFSPGVMVNVTDAGFLEPASYSLLFGAAFLSFVKAPNKSQFMLLCLSAVVLMLACNFSFLFWNLIIIPLFFGIYFLLNVPPRVYVWEALKKPGLAGWAFFVLASIIAVSPNITAYLATTELVKPSLESQAYQFEHLKSGNPLSLFAAGLPGFGFEWVADKSGITHPDWTLLPRKTGVHFAYNYMGILCVPLAIFGLLFGRNPIRFFIFLVLLVLFGVINLSAYSPWFAGVLFIESPLRAVNHYSDLLFRSGGFIVLLFAAALGLDTAIRCSAIHRKTLLKLYAGYTLTCVAVFIGVRGQHALSSPTFGFMIFIATAIAIILTWMVFTLKKRDLRISVVLLLLATLLDVSTNVFLHIRQVITNHESAYRLVSETPSPMGVGVTVSGDPYYFVNNVLRYRNLLQLQKTGFEFSRFGLIKLFRAAHTNENISLEVARIRELQYTNYHSIVLAPENTSDPAFKPFFENAIFTPASGALDMVKYTYNRVNLKVRSGSPALLFVMDAYSKYWKATVNGRETPIARGLYNFKAIPIPSGESNVLLEYSPDRVPAALFLAYSLFVGLAIYAAVVHRHGLFRLRRNSANKTP